MNRIVLFLLCTITFSSNCLLAAEDKLPHAVLLEQAVEFEPDIFPSQLLTQWIGDRRIVLIGDATHGSHEFYRYRAEISRYLIEHHGFSTVIIEGNWPAAKQVDEYIKLASENTAKKALRGFKSNFPWLWRNQTLLEFIQWLRQYNKSIKQPAASFYGMDLFSLSASIQKNIALLEKYNTALNSQLKALLSCFPRFKNNTLEYGRSVARHPQSSCQIEAEKQFRLISEHPHLINNKQDYQDLRINSLIIRAAEQYFRMTFQADAVDSWNMREQFMLEMINYIVQQSDGHKVIIWAHNSHVGDARATGMRKQNRKSLGQLLRQQRGEDDVFLLGSLSYQGELIASKQWGGVAEQMTMPPAIDGSYAHLFHQLNLSRFILNFDELRFTPFYQRFIGVVYEPEQEQLYNYDTTEIDRQFDAVLFVDQTTAVQQLE